MGAKKKGGTYQRRPFYEVGGDTPMHWAAELRLATGVEWIDPNKDVREQLHPDAQAVYDQRKAESEWWSEQTRAVGVDPGWGELLSQEAARIERDGVPESDPRRLAVADAERLLRTQLVFYARERVAELQWQGAMNDALADVKAIATAAAIRKSELSMLASRSGGYAVELTVAARQHVESVARAADALADALVAARSANADWQGGSRLLRRPGAIGRPADALRTKLIEALRAKESRAYTHEEAAAILEPSLRQPSRRARGGDPAANQRKRNRRLSPPRS